MSDHMRDWLGKTIEDELRDAIEWKRRGSERTPKSKKSEDALPDSPPVRDFTEDRQFEQLFRDDGSSLSARFVRAKNQAWIVQIGSISTSGKCELSDGYTKIRAKFSKKAQKAFSAEHNGMEISDLNVGGFINIPEFEIMATTLGKAEEQIQLLIHYARVVHNVRPVRSGNPEDIRNRALVRPLMEEYNHLRDAELPQEEDDSDIEVIPSMVRPHSQAGSTQDYSQGNGKSQSFLTQAPVRPARKNNGEGSSGLNLAPPVAPRRNDPERTTTGSKPTAWLGGARNPLDLLKFLPAQIQPVRAIDNPPSPPRRSIDQPPSQSHIVSTPPKQAGRSFKALFGAHNNRARTLQPGDHAQTSARDEVDLGREHQLPNTSAHRKPGTPSLASDRGRESPDATVMNDTLFTKDLPERVDACEDRPIDAPQSYTVRQEGGKVQQSTFETTENQSPPRGQQSLSREPEVRQQESYAPLSRSPSLSILNVTESTSPRQEVPWHGIMKISRSHCIIPSDQKELLDRKESWNPPNPGQTFPSPNVPRAVVEQLDRIRAENNRKSAENEVLNSTVISEAVHQNGSAESDLSRSPSPTCSDSEGEPLPGWEDSQTDQRNELPPDSSAVTRAGQDSSPEKPFDQSSSPSRRFQPGAMSRNASTTPKSAGRGQMLPPESPNYAKTSKLFDEAGSGSYQLSSPYRKHKLSSIEHTSEMFSSPDHARQTQGGILQPSTLSTSEFGDIDHRTRTQYSSPHRSQQSRHSTAGASPVKIEIQSTITPDFQSGQILPRAITVDGTYEHKGDIPTSDIDGTLAEQQLQQEFQASATKTSKNDRLNRPPSAGRAEPSSPSRIPLARDDDEMEVNATTPPPVLGIRKRVTSSPLSPEGRPRKSRFGFSQEDPVSQDPAITVRLIKREFMHKKNATKKREHRPLEDARRRSSDQHREPPSSPKRTSSQQRQPRENHTPVRLANVALDSSPPIPSTNYRIPVSPFRSPFGQHVSDEQTPIPIPNQQNMDVPPNEDVDMEEPRHQLSSAQKPPNITQVTRPLPPKPITVEDSIFQEFTAAYPSYNGDMKHFKNIAREIYQINKGGAMFPPLMWDDYIIRHKTNYFPYSVNCLTSGETPQAFKKYYMDHFEEPMHTKRVLKKPQLDVMFGNAHASQHNDPQSTLLGQRGRSSSGRGAAAFIDSYRPSSAQSRERPPNKKRKSESMLLMNLPQPTPMTLKPGNAFAPSGLPRNTPTGPKQRAPPTSATAPAQRAPSSTAQRTSSSGKGRAMPQDQSRSHSTRLHTTGSNVRRNDHANRGLKIRKF